MLLSGAGGLGAERRAGDGMRRETLAIALGADEQQADQAAPKSRRGSYLPPPGALYERQLVPVSGGCHDSLRAFPLTCSLRGRPIPAVQ